LIGGEASYHDQLLAQALGLELVLKGHRETEEIVVPVLAAQLRAKLTEVAVLC